MLNKLLVLLLIVGCGKEIKPSNSKLESLSQITQSEAINVNEDGVLIRTNETPLGKMVVQGRTYVISRYSSQMAYDFINSRPMGMEIPVRFKGTKNEAEILVEMIQAQ